MAAQAGSYNAKRNEMPIYTYIETEDFDSISNGSIRSGGFASGGQYVQHVGSGDLVLSTTLDGTPGTYDLAVSYFDENDGQSQATLKIDGVTIDSWTWSQNLGSKLADMNTRTTHVIENVTLDESAVIEISGSRDGGEEFRFDNIELLPASEGVGDMSLSSFPGAEGYGAVTVGGRGGAIVKVTNLNDSGEGSLRWALEDLEMPRIVVFEVGGQIKLNTEIEVRGDVTVAGQTAPGEGVTVTGARLHVVESDVIIQGLKVRPGATSNDDLESRDAISIGSGDRDVSRVIIDSNSFSWAVDETAVVWFGAHDITFSNNIFAEGLDNNKPSYGMLLGDDSHNITVVDNLFASNAHRNPQLLRANQVEFVNNVVSNYGNNGFEAPVGGDGHSSAHIIGNVFVPGDDTSTSLPVRLNGTTSETEYYLYDNIGPGRPTSDLPETAIAEGSGQSLVSTSPVFASSNVAAMDSSQVLESVLSTVGARAQGVDSTDARILGDVLDGGGHIISWPSEVGGFDAPTSYDALADRDDDGIPDVYEERVGANVNRFDPHIDSNNNGITNIEEYLSGLLDGFDFGSGNLPDIYVEAEDLTLVRGFALDTNTHASEKQLIRAVGNADSLARYTFDGQDGNYDLRIGYFDETDGSSTLAVLVNGVKVDEWSWDQDLGSAIVTAGTHADHTVLGLELEAGDEISLLGQKDGGEPLRIDTLDFLA